MAARGRSTKNLFLTGPSGVGKTTMLFRALQASGLDYGGFVVKRRCAQGRRVSMDMVDLTSGRRAPIAFFDELGGVHPAPEAFGILGVFAITTALRSGRPIVMDELGRFEIAVPEFVDAVFRALESRAPVIGVLKAESNPFLDSVRSRRDVAVVPVDRDNRARADSVLLTFLGSCRGSDVPLGYRGGTSTATHSTLRPLAQTAQAIHSRNRRESRGEAAVADLVGSPPDGVPSRVEGD